MPGRLPRPVYAAGAGAGAGAGFVGGAVAGGGEYGGGGGCDPIGPTPDPESCVSVESVDAMLGEKASVADAVDATVGERSAVDKSGSVLACRGLSAVLSYMIVLNLVRREYESRNAEPA